MSELDASARFIKDYDWLAILILVVVAWLLGFVHSDREMKAQASAYEKALQQRDERFAEMRADRDTYRQQAQDAIKALEQLTDVMEPIQTRRRGP
jgi:uncharacterized membrane protein